MYKEDNLRISKIFDKNSDRYGRGHLALGWVSNYTQYIRFVVLGMVGDLDGASVLDVGCGQGDLVKFFKDESLVLSYTGIDISVKMVMDAKVRFPKCRFITTDFLDESFNLTADYVMASGTFNIKVDKSYDYIFACMKKMLSLAHKGVAFNLLSSYVPKEKQDAFFFYYEPDKILKLAFSLTPHVELKHSYLDNDFTVYLFV
jgi:SAM-dependent methyltransferase